MANSIVYRHGLPDYPGGNPGAPAAVQAGCTCPVADNAAGQGLYVGGYLAFKVEADCPVHDPVPPPAESSAAELARLRAENAHLRTVIAKMRAEAEVH